MVSIPEGIETRELIKGLGQLNKTPSKPSCSLRMKLGIFLENQVNHFSLQDRFFNYWTQQIELDLKVTKVD